jgi:hypothetical protein
VGSCGEAWLWQQGAPVGQSHTDTTLLLLPSWTHAGNSKGFGFVSFDCFEAADAAIEGMHGQYLCNRQIAVSYAYKKDTKGECAGSE